MDKPKKKYCQDTYHDTLCDCRDVKHYNQACDDWEEWLVERLEKITDGYQITKTQAKVNALIKEIKGE